MRRVLSSCSLSLEAVKYGHTISAVGVEPCTGRLYFSGGGEEERAPEGGRDWATSVERGKGGDEGGDGRRKGEAKEETGKNEVLL